MLIDSVVPARALAQHGLRDDADAEHDQHERAEELGEHLADERRSHRAPPETSAGGSL